MNLSVLQQERAEAEAMRKVVRALLRYPEPGQSLRAWAEEVGVDFYERIEAEECERAGVTVEQWDAWTRDPQKLRREMLRTIAEHGPTTRTLTDAFNARL